MVGLLIVSVVQTIARRQLGTFHWGAGDLDAGPRGKNSSVVLDETEES